MKKKLIVIIILLLAIASALAYYFIDGSAPVKEEEKIEDIEVVEDDRKLADKSLRDTWITNKGFNEDYIGEVNFESGLIKLPFVCPSKPYDQYKFFAYTGTKVTNFESGCEGGACSGNDVYLRMDWKTMKFELGGSVFMDYRNSIYDQNIIIYGHHYPKNLDKDRVLFFTPLEKLMEKENYEDNKYVDIVLENEVRRYEIAYVYLFHTNPNQYDDYDSLQYYRTNYEYDYYGDPDEGYYQKYIDKMESVKLYDTGVKLSTDDRTLTLQTCLENTDQAVEIVVCKEIETLYYE